MNCIHCGGRMQRSKAPFHVDRNGYHLLFDTVPAWVCDQCGEAYFEELEIAAVQSAIKGLDRQARQFAVGAREDLWHSQGYSGQGSGENHVTTERTPLGEEIEAALGEVLAHACGDETALPCRVVDDRAAERNTRRSAMTQTSEGGSLTTRGGVIHSRKDTMGGTPVFKGTRVVVKNLFDYLAGGYSLDEFLAHFPSVSREQAIRALDMAREVLEQTAYETAAQ